MDGGFEVEGCFYEGDELRGGGCGVEGDGLDGGFGVEGGCY